MNLPSIFIAPTRKARQAFAENRDEIGGQCYDRLRLELRDALLQEPMRMVATPGFSANRKMSATEVFMDRFGGSKWQENSYELVRLLADAAQGHDVQLRAMLMIDEASQEHAAWHESDALEQLEASL